MQRYNPKDIEPKWQKLWEEQGIYRATEDLTKPKKYVLEYFPYPSGAAMHVGHVRNYTIGDAVSRFNRMRGYNVLHPMGWDAFGLPAENYAIKTGVSPRQAIDQNTTRFKEQLMQMGFGYDWSREIDSTDPAYYKWTQWFFLMLFKRGLAYQHESLQWWCPVDKTVLANEQVEAGRCWRCGNEVEKKALNQWFFKITDYADRLLEDLDDLDWSDAIKSMQRNWIGKSKGAEIDFHVVSDNNYVLLHGFTGSSMTDFFPWLKAKLEKQGAKVWTENLPNSDKPSAEEQAEYVLKNAHFNENTVLLGHSYGSVSALRVVEQLKKPIKTLVLVAGFAEPGFLDRERTFEKTTNWEFDFEKIKQNVKEVIILRAENDSAVPRERANFLQSKLGGKIVDFVAENDHVTADKEPAVFNNLANTIRIFTTRPDTLFGATFMVLAPEHTLLKEIAKDSQKQEINSYVRATQAKSDIDRAETDREKTGVFTGAYAINPVNDEKIPIWIADYVLSGYGTGAIMAVPAHDQRDFEFAQKFELPVRIVIEPTYGAPEGDEAHKESVFVIVHNPKANKVVVLDWGPRQARHGGKMLIGGGVEGGETYQAAAEREITEETGYKNFKLVKEADFLGHGYFYSNTKDKNMHVSGKGLLYELINEERAETNLDDGEKDKFKVTWQPVEQVADMLDDGIHEAFYRYLMLGECYTGEGVMINSNPYDGQSSSDARENIVADLAKNKQGDEKINYKMRDWLISRQRYWGAPIPIIHCLKDGAVAVPDDQLPMVLPELKNFEPSGDGRSPLANIPEFVDTTCPQCGGPAQRETDTMDGFACSSWYFLRFADPHNDKQAFDVDKAEFWLPVDDYIGGAEHAVMHLLYARFWTKVMFDEGLITFEEPFSTLRNHGMILAPDGQKMSKSKGNTIEPEELLEQGYGADAIRIMELFIGPWNQSANWSVEGMGGAFRFLQRIWTLVQEYLDTKTTESKTDNVELQRIIHKAIKRVSEDLHEMGFNTAIAALMETVNDMYKLKMEYPPTGKEWEQALSVLLQLLAPFAPHITEELWQQLGMEGSVHQSSWPVHDEKYLVQDKITIVVQVNGKVRATIEVPANADEEQTVAAAKANEKVAGYLTGHEIKKTIYVPVKLVNFVI